MSDWSRRFHDKLGEAGKHLPPLKTSTDGKEKNVDYPFICISVFNQCALLAMDFMALLKKGYSLFMKTYIILNSPELNVLHLDIIIMELSRGS